MDIWYSHPHSIDQFDVYSCLFADIVHSRHSHQHAVRRSKHERILHERQQQFATVRCYLERLQLNVLQRQCTTQSSSPAPEPATPPTTAKQSECTIRRVDPVLQLKSNVHQRQWDYVHQIGNTVQHKYERFQSSSSPAAAATTTTANQSAATIQFQSLYHSTNANKYSRHCSHR